MPVGAADKVQLVDANGVAFGTAGNPVTTTAGGGGGGGAVTVADGADVTQGAVADAVVASGAPGTVSAKLRRLTTDLNALNTAVGATNTLLGAGLPAALVGGRLPVDVGASALPTGAATSAKQDTAQTTLTAIDGHVDGVETLLAGGLPAALATGGGLKSDLTTITGLAPNLGSGNAGTGTLRVILATDQPATTTPFNVQGNVASDVAVTANPQLGGGRASTAVPTAVSADGRAVANWLTRNGATVVDGGVASAATDSGNPVKVGGRYNSSIPTFTDGQRADLQIGSRGALNVQIQQANGTGLATVVAGADALGIQTGLAVTAWQQLWNGASSDRARGNVDTIILASASRTTTQTGADTTNYNGRGILVVLDVTIAGTGSITVSVQGKDANGIYYTMFSGAAVTTVVSNAYVVYPSVAAVANSAASLPIPRVYRVVVTANNANAMTYSLSSSLLV